ADEDDGKIDIDIVEARFDLLHRDVDGAGNMAGSEFGAGTHIHKQGHARRAISQLRDRYGGIQSSSYIREERWSSEKDSGVCHASDWCGISTYCDFSSLCRSHSINICSFGLSKAMSRWRMLRPLTKWQTSSARFLAWSPARSRDCVMKIICRLAWGATFSGFSMCRKKMILRNRSISASARSTSIAFLTSRWEKDWPTSDSIFSRTVAIWVKSRASCESIRPPTAWALLAKLKSRSPMRSSPIMTFIHPSSCRVSASGTRVMQAVTPESTSRSMASSSFSHSRIAFRRDMDPVAMPSAAMAAASRASSHASTVRCTRPECEGSGKGVFTLAVLIG